MTNMNDREEHVMGEVLEQQVQDILDDHKDELKEAYACLKTTSKQTTDLPDPDRPIEVLEWWRKSV